MRFHFRVESQEAVGAPCLFDSHTNGQVAGLLPKVVGFLEKIPDIILQES